MMSCHRKRRRRRLRRRCRVVTTGLNRARIERRVLLTGMARFDKEMADLQSGKRDEHETCIATTKCAGIDELWDDVDGAAEPTSPSVVRNNWSVDVVR